MTRLLALLILVFTMLSAATNATATESATSITLSMERYDNPLYNENSSNKHRTPPRRIDCTITTEGIASSSFDAADITAYEVYDSDGNLLASFVDEQDFISYVFAAAGTLEIRLHFDEYALYGYVSI